MRRTNCDHRCSIVPCMISHTQRMHVGFGMFRGTCSTRSHGVRIADIPPYNYMHMYLLITFISKSLPQHFSGQVRKINDVNTRYSGNAYNFFFFFLSLPTDMVPGFKSATSLRAYMNIHCLLVVRSFRLHTRYTHARMIGLLAK